MPISPATIPSLPFFTSNRYTSSLTPDESDSNIDVAMLFFIFNNTIIIETLKHNNHLNTTLFFYNGAEMRYKTLCCDYANYIEVKASSRLLCFASIVKQCRLI